MFDTCSAGIKAREQAAQDLRAFLTSRAAEMKPGSYLLSTFTSLSDDKADGSTLQIERLLDEAWAALLDKNVISEAEYSNFTLPSECQYIFYHSYLHTKTLVCWSHQVSKSASGSEWTHCMKLVLRHYWIIDNAFASQMPNRHVMRGLLWYLFSGK